MSESKNSLDVRLLNDNPNELVEKYQYIIEAVVMRFIRRGFFDSSEKQEIVQTINLKLLDGKMKKIRQNFNGSVFLTTYFSKVIHNACLEMIRSRRRRPVVVSDEVLEFQKTDAPSPEKNMLIADEMMRLEAILRGFQRRKAKLLFCLKLYARKIIDPSDLNQLSQGLGVALKKEDLHILFYDDYDKLNDKDVYLAIVPFFNKLENKRADADSLRKWLNMQIDKIITLLNGNPPTSHYERQTLRILLGLYFDRKKETVFSGKGNSERIV